MNFTELLHFDLDCEIVATDTAALLAVGDRAAALSEHFCQSGLTPPRARLDPPAGILFGLAILTEPYPILVNSLMTEHNARLDQLSLFGWIEENAILEPRAEILGLTPLGQEPVLFLRDLDLDRPPEAWLKTGQPARWLRVVGVALADGRHDGDPLPISGDEAALAALERVAPQDAQPFVADLRATVAGGVLLRSALRQRRKATASGLMRLCDGWRVLSRAARFARFNPDSGPRRGQGEGLFRLELPRKW